MGARRRAGRWQCVAHGASAGGGARDLSGEAWLAEGDAAGSRQRLIAAPPKAARGLVLFLLSSWNLAGLRWLIVWPDKQAGECYRKHSCRLRQKASPIGSVHLGGFHRQRRPESAPSPRAWALPGLRSDVLPTACRDLLAACSTGDLGDVVRSGPGSALIMD